MPTVAEYLATVDAYLAARKQAIGIDAAQLWREGRAVGEDELVIKFPIEVAGEQALTNSLVLSAFPDADDLKFSISLVCHWAVYRLDYELGRAHANNNRPHGLDIPAMVIGPHYHPWLQNRSTIHDVSTPIKLSVALPLDVHIRQFDQAFRWFCQQTNIELRDHEIELPPRQRLL